MEEPSAEGRYWTSLKLDASGNPVISYFDVTNGDLKLARVQTAHQVGVSLSRFGYSNPVGFTGTETVDINSGDLSIAHESNGAIRAVWGVVTVPANPGPGDATIAVSIQRFWITSVYIGNVRVVDPSAGASVSTPIFFQQVAKVGDNGVRGSASWFAFMPPFSFLTYRLTCTFIDNS